MNNSLEDLLYQITDCYPNKTAIEYGIKSSTYFEVDQRSNLIATFIIQKGFKKGAKIGILVDDRIDLIYLVIGILKSGCIFVPFDSSFPYKRLETMVDSVDLDLFFTNESNNDLAINLFTEQTKKPEILTIESVGVDYEPSKVTRPEIRNEPNDPIYIYFTSGSTGKPKGILGRYKGLVHFIKWEIETFQINSEYRTSQFTTPSFDAFLRDIFVPLCTGATLCIPEDKDILLSAEKLAQWIDKAKINLIHCVPSLFRLILSSNLKLDYFKELKYILMSGERISPKDLRRWYGIFDERIQLVNLYGPSETTMVKTYYFIQKEDQNKSSISIGQPMKVARVLILDDNFKSTPKEMVGEIYIRTPYMTLGYYNDPVLTAERFIQNPYSDNPNDRLYKTGDLGRVLNDGNLELIGRKDHQIKIRGVRVEPGDIESQLVTNEAVKEAVIIARENKDGEIYLTAYIVTSKALTGTNFKDYLSTRLPDYMVPAFFVTLDKMPLTPNGKIDRKALPEPDFRMSLGVEYVAPENEVEEKLVDIWSDLLDIDNIGIIDNFFDLGGHSLKATQLELKIYKEMDVEIPLRLIFEKSTIKELADYILKADRVKYVSIKRVEEKEHYPASFAQKRLFALNQVTGNNLGYNMPRVFILDGELDKVRLEKALHDLVKRHASLRTSFSVINNETVQIIHDDVDINIDYIKSDETSDSAIKEIIKNFIKPFDFDKAPLFRVALAEMTENKHLILFDMHHIISDGISMNILIEEFFSYYQGTDLSEILIQYKDFAVWQNELVESGEIEKQEKYWLDVLEGDIPVLSLPTDNPRPQIKGYEGDSVYFNIDNELRDQLNQLANENGATLYMVLLAVYNLFLSKYSGQNDIIVGTPVAGRPHPDLEQIIGMFVNTLPMRNYPVQDKRFDQFLDEVKENTLKGFRKSGLSVRFTR